MIALIDYDNLIYKSAYKVVSIQDIKQKISEGKKRDELEKWIMDECINRLCNIGDGLMTEIESNDFFTYQDCWLSEFEKNHFFLFLGTKRKYETIEL